MERIKTKLLFLFELNPDLKLCNINWGFPDYDEYIYFNKDDNCIWYYCKEPYYTTNGPASIALKAKGKWVEWKENNIKR